MNAWLVISTFLWSSLTFILYYDKSVTTSANKLAPCREEGECNSKLKCNPQTRVLFGKFLIRCWGNARSEIGLSNPFNISIKSFSDRLSFKTAVQNVVLKVYNYNSGALIYYKNWQPIAYIRSHNVKEPSVLSFLSIACQQPSSSSLLFSEQRSRAKAPMNLAAAYQHAKSQSKMKLLVAAMAPSSNGTVSKSARSFTVVADPVARFSYGYQNSIFRLYWQSNGAMKVNSSSVRQHLNKLFDYERPIPSTYDNLLPISGAFFDFNVDVFARQEYLEEDWKNIVCPWYSSVELCSSSAADLDTSAKEFLTDDHDALAALKELFVSEPQYLRAVCYMLLVDYVCMPMYVLPGPCQFLNATRRAAEEALAEGKELPHEF